VSWGFDLPGDRRARNATKWRVAEKATNDDGEPVIPMWIADMDFRAPPAVLDALQAAIAHGIPGYQEWSEDFPALFCRWQARRHRWTLSPEWLLPCQSVVGALDVIVDSLSQPGDEIIVFSPGFAAFSRVIQQTQRRVVTVPLRVNGLEYALDPDRLTAAITPRTRMLILCNPHNPLGKAWCQNELQQIIDICLRHICCWCRTMCIRICIFLSRITPPSPRLTPPLPPARSPSRRPAKPLTLAVCRSPIW